MIVILIHQTFHCFTQMDHQKKHRTDISDAHTGAAIAFVEDIGGKSKVEECQSTNAVPQASTMSPSKRLNFV